MDKVRFGRRAARLVSAYGLCAGALLAADPAWARCVTTGASVVCDTSSPNPEANGAVGNDIRILTGAQVQLDDPNAGASQRLDVVIVTPGGRLTSDTGSIVTAPVTGETAVAAGRGATIDLTGQIGTGFTNTGSAVPRHAISLAEGATLLVRSGGDVFNSSSRGYAVQVTGAGTRIQIDGTVREFGFIDPGISMTTTDLFGNTTGYASNITVGAGGSVTSTQTPTIGLTGGSTLTVAGTLTTRLNAAAIRVDPGPGTTAVIDIAAGGTVESLTGIAIASSGTAVDLTIAGTVTSGTNLPAVSLSAANDRVTLRTGANVAGTIDAGGGTDALVLAGTGSGQLNSIANFETLNVDSGSWTLAAPISPQINAGIASGATLIGSSALLSGPIRNDGTLVFNEGATATFAAPVSGSGALVKQGTGTLVLSGVSSYTGATSVSAGTLAVTGSIAGSRATVAAGATLAGSGTIGGATINGAISPTGILTVNGAYTQAAGSTYSWQAGDLIRVNGTASILGGRVQATNTPTQFQLGNRTAILTATGGRAGQYAGLDLSGPSSLLFLTLGLTYDANNVYLEAVRNGTTFASTGAMVNQRAAAGGLDTLNLSNPLIVTLANIGDIATARQAFDALSGEIHATLKGTLLEDSRFLRDAVQTRMTSASEEGSGLWVQALAGKGDSDSNGNAASYDQWTWGWLFGLDTAVGTGIRAGLLAGYSRSHINGDARASQAEIDSFHLGGYAGGRWGGTHLNVGATLSWNDIATKRGIAFTGFSDRAQVHYNGREVHVFAEGGHRFALGSAGLEPFAGIAWARLSTDAFTETANSAGVQAPKQHESTAWTTLGLRGDVPLGASLKAYGSAAWRRTIDGRLPAATLSFSSGSPFTVYGTPLDKDTALVSAGLALLLRGNAQVTLGYSGSIGSNRHDHGARAGLSFEF